MRKQRPLYERLYRDPLLIDLARRIGYLGFAYRELATRCRDLATTHDPECLRIALDDIATFTNGRVMLNKAGRKAAWQLLGPPPEKWPEVYEHVAHRPANWDNPPTIPQGDPDPLMETVRLYAPMGLLERLNLVRRSLANDNNSAFLENQYRDELQCLEAEMVRRGIAIPPEPDEEGEAMRRAVAKSRKPVKRKKAG